MSTINREYDLLAITVTKVMSSSWDTTKKAALSLDLDLSWNWSLGSAGWSPLGAHCCCLQWKSHASSPRDCQFDLANLPLVTRRSALALLTVKHLIHLIASMSYYMPYTHCVTWAPLLYFIRSWVALSFKVVSLSVSQASVTPVQISTLCNI